MTVLSPGAPSALSPSSRYRRAAESWVSADEGKRLSVVNAFRSEGEREAAFVLSAEAARWDLFFDLYLNGAPVRALGPDLAGQCVEPAAVALLASQSGFGRGQCDIASHMLLNDLSVVGYGRADGVKVGALPKAVLGAAKLWPGAYEGALITAWMNHSMDDTKALVAARVPHFGLTLSLFLARDDKRYERWLQADPAPSVLSACLRSDTASLATPRGVALTVAYGGQFGGECDLTSWAHHMQRWPADPGGVLEGLPQEHLLGLCQIAEAGGRPDVAQFIEGMAARAAPAVTKRLSARMA